MRKAKQRQAKYTDQTAKSIEFAIGDPVYHNNHQRKDKLDLKWKPYYRITEKKATVSYVIKNQLDGFTSHVHAESLRHAHIDEWDKQYHKDSRLRDATLAVLIQDTLDSDTDSNSENENSTSLNDNC